MLEHLFLHIAKHDSKQREKERREFDEQFNNLDVEELQENSAQADCARDAVRQELQDPKSAVFRELFIRRCPDGVVRAAGIVMVMAPGAGLSAAGYTVEFRGNGQAQVLDLVPGFDPVAIKSPAYENPANVAWRTAEKDRREDRAFLRGCFYAVGVVILLLVGGFIYCWLGLAH
jgi:hypothetical protein